MERLLHSMIVILFVLTAFLALSGSDAQRSACDLHSSIDNIKGSITQLSREGSVVQRFLLDGKREPGAALFLVWINLQTDTQIVEQKGTVCSAATLDLLGLGELVHVETTGSLISSDPPQVMATKILVFDGQTASA